MSKSPTDDTSIPITPDATILNPVTTNDKTVIIPEEQASAENKTVLSPLSNTLNIQASAEDKTVLSPIPDTSSTSDKTIIDPLVSNNVNTEDETILQAIPEANKTRLKNVENSDKSNTNSESIQVGSLIKNRFIIKEALGSGGMGTVFRATDLRKQEAQDQHTDVAIKVLNDEFKEDPTLFIALQREAKKTQLLAHPNIITVYDFDKDGSNVFIVMELLEGKTLSEFIREDCQSGLPFKEAWPVINGLASALAIAHKKNIIHSDFKPGNAFITAEGEVKVLDFGIASAATVAGVTPDIFNARDLGALTPAYASLEMFLGKDPSPADDVYALACVCYEILSGKHPYLNDKPPYEKQSAEKALQAKLTVPNIAGLSRRVRAALLHGLALQQEQRTATASDFLEEIRPKSVLAKVLGGLALSSALVAAAGFYYVNYEMTFVDEQMIALSPKQAQQVSDFLELAQMHFEVGFLTAPSGSNAVWAYKQVLSIAPYDQQAQEGLKKIADIIEQQAADLYVTGESQASLAKIEEGLTAVPKHDNLLDLKARILSSEKL